MKELILTKGAVALVDDEDYEVLGAYKWSLSCTGYAVRGYRENNRVRTVKMHREILGKNCEGFEVDHINGNKLDNRRENLRIATRSQNAANISRRKTQNSTSKYKGVKRGKGRERWTAQICMNKRTVHLGQFDTEEDAARAYNDAALKYFGQFAKLNILTRGGKTNGN